MPRFYNIGRMRRPLLLALLAAAPAAAAAPEPAPGSLGVGAYFGVPFGATVKYNVDSKLAADAAFGVQNGDFAAQTDVLVRLPEAGLKPRVGSLAPYLGLGLKLIDERRTFLGVRFVGGLSYLAEHSPVEAFAEIGPTLRVAPSAGGAIDGGVGIRYYFDLPRAAR